MFLQETTYPGSILFTQVTVAAYAIICAPYESDPKPQGHCFSKTLWSLEGDTVPPGLRRGEL